MTDSIAKPLSPLDEEQVAEYLLENPGFFVGRDALLTQLTLPHKRGTAISLVERQLAILRERDEELHRRLDILVDNAKNSERLFGRIRQLVLSLLESQDTEQAIESLKDSLSHDFNLEFHSLILYSSQPRTAPVRFESRDITESILGTSFTEGDAFCGALDKQQTEFLFGKQADNIQSMAVSPLNFPDQIGILALGSREEHHFRATMGTLFVRYLGDVLSRVLARLIRLPDNPPQEAQQNQ